MIKPTYQGQIILDYLLSYNFHEKSMNKQELIDYPT